MHSQDAKGLEDVHRHVISNQNPRESSHNKISSRSFPHPPSGIDSRRHGFWLEEENRDNDFVLPPTSITRPLGKSQSEFIVPYDPVYRNWHLESRSQDALYGNIAGLPETNTVRATRDVSTSSGQRVSQHEPRMKRDNVTNDSEEEYFVDGNFFFNHLVRHKEAEDYNMAEMLRERSRELQRRNVLSARFPRQDRLSQSLPVEPSSSSKRFYYVNENPKVSEETSSNLPPVEQERRIEFAGGLEIEIPPRRHAGIGGGGLLRESASADRLLMVPTSHKNSEEIFGQKYFKTAGNSGSSQNPLPKISSSYSAINFATRSSSRPPPIIPSQSFDQEKYYTKVTKDQSRIVNAGIEPASNRYNVRTGRLEPSPDFAPKIPPKLYNIEDSNSLAVSHPGESLGLSGSTEPSQKRDQQLSRNINQSHVTNVPARNWERAASNDNPFSSTHPKQPKTNSPQSGNTLANLSPHPNNTLTSRKAVTWQDDASPSQLTPKSPHQNSRDEFINSRDGTFGEIPNIHFPLSDSLARNFIIEDLHEVDQFALFEVSNSKLPWGEGFMGSDWLDKTKQYKFVVLNRNEEVLFVGVEEESSLSECISSPQKSSFSVRILDASGREVVNFRRLYSIKSKGSFSSGNKTKYRLEVSTPEGHVIGNVEKTYDSDNYYILEDRTGEFMFLIQRSCICTCPLFWDYEFKILLPESGTEIGEISWSYLTAQNEQFHGTEISFPIELNTISKVMLLGVCFLLNFSRWQSSYLDAIYNPWKRKENYSFCPWRSSENKELAALLRSSPDVEGFQRNADVVDDDIELEPNSQMASNQPVSNTSQSLSR